MEAGVTVCVEEVLVNFIFLPHTHTLTHASTHFSTSHSHTHPRLYPSTLLLPIHPPSYPTFDPSTLFPTLPPFHLPSPPGAKLWRCRGRGGKEGGRGRGGSCI